MAFRLQAGTDEFLLQDGVDKLLLQDEGASGLTVSPPAGSLSLAADAPSVLQNSTVDPPSGELTVVTRFGLRFVGHTPTIEVTTSQDLVVEPPVVALTIATAAPSAEIDHLSAPGVDDLQIAAEAPTVSTTDNKEAAPPVVGLNIASDAPSAFIQTVEAPPAGFLTLSGIAPTIAVTDFKVAQTPSGALGITGQAPAADLSGSAINVPVPAGSLIINSDAPGAALSTKDAAGWILWDFFLNQDLAGGAADDDRDRLLIELRRLQHEQVLEIIKVVLEEAA